MPDALLTAARKPKWQSGDYCDRCINTGEIDCYCGGDLCICGRQFLPCPQCGGWDIEEYDDEF